MDDLNNRKPLRRILSIRGLSRKEQDNLYDIKNTKSGKCFRQGNHFYLQRKYDVLHLLLEENNFIFNTLHPSYINFLREDKKENLKEITQEEYLYAVKETIYNFNIEDFWKR